MQRLSKKDLENLIIKYQERIDELKYQNENFLNDKSSDMIKGLTMSYERVIVDLKELINV